MQTDNLNEINEIIEIFKNFREDILQIENILNLIFKNIDMILENEIIIKINTPVLIAGDIHGNFNDVRAIVIKFMELYKENNKIKLLFLGDYIDRGDYSIEVITFLFYLKIKYPNNIFLLRGNHETEIDKFYSNSLYNDLCGLFKSSFCEKYEMYLNCFAKLPIIAIIDNTYFCSHGGIPRPNDGISFDVCYEILKKSKLPCITNFSSYNKQIDTTYEMQLIAKYIYGILWSDPLGFQDYVSNNYVKKYFNIDQNDNKDIKTNININTNTNTNTNININMELDEDYVDEDEGFVILKNISDDYVDEDEGFVILENISDDYVDKDEDFVILENISDDYVKLKPIILNNNINLDEINDYSIDNCLTDKYFGVNILRCSGDEIYTFSYMATKKFCEKLHFKAIIRAHQYTSDGLVFCHDNQVITVFSSSNYCGNKNMASILYIPDSASGKTTLEDIFPFCSLALCNKYDHLKKIIDVKICIEDNLQIGLLK